MAISLLSAEVLFKAYVESVLRESDLTPEQMPRLATQRCLMTDEYSLFLIQPAGYTSVQHSVERRLSCTEWMHPDKYQREIVGACDSAIKEYHFKVTGRTFIRRDELQKALNLYLPQFGRFCGGVAKAWLRHTAAPQFAMLAGFCAAIVDIYSDPTILRGSLLELD